VNIEEIRGEDYGIRPFRGEKFRYLQGVSLENYPKHEPIAPKIVSDWDRHGGLKFPGLEGKLRKSVGRPFAKIYSELCEEIRHSPAFNGKDYNYIRSMIEWKVEFAPYEVDGMKGVFAGATGRPITKFFVHPRTGILSEPKKSWRKIVTDPRYESRTNYWSHEVRYINNVCYRRINGNWFEVILANIPKIPSFYEYQYNYRRHQDDVEKLNIYDVVMKLKMSSWTGCDTFEKYHGVRTFDNRLLPPTVKSHYYNENLNLWCGPTRRTVYAKALRQLSAKEIRRMNLGPQLKVPNYV
jgi:hypothetical protein